MLDIKLVPVLLGGDLNSYNVARAFHEKYGVKTHVFGRYPIGPTKDSRIVDFHVVPKLDTDDIMVAEMRNFAEKNGGAALILLGCTDDYAAMIIRNKDRLEDKYICPYIDAELMDKLVSKAVFYEMCEKYGIPYPKTKVLTSEYSEGDFSEDSLGFSYPIIVKPSSSIAYWKHPFDGMKKVYTAENPAEAEKIVDEIYGAGYPDKMILQDMIPGDDSNMNVLTAYSDKDKKVKMMCLGHVLLEEHTPKGLGNHAAIITEHRPDITAPFRAMLDDVGYRGFSNFDIKYDPRDGSMRAFEINLRQGRSNFYITAAGINIAELLVRDNFLGETLDYTECKESHLWHTIPFGVVKKYVHDAPSLEKAKKLKREGKSKTSLWYAYDLMRSPKRLIWVAEHMRRQYGKYKKYCK
ncbi:MAG: ATP-grasp domain-containing protein [Ruminococcaceae bacterium]|nr:ATP-grasp domain-containing protein [Oscillospiraceae bacterium]